MTSKHPDVIEIENMLNIREAGVVEWSLVTRLAFFGLFIILLLLHLAGLIRPGIAAETDTDAQWSLTMLIGSSACIAYGFFLVRRGQYLLSVGLGAVLLDIFLLACLPIIWYSALDIPDGSPVFLMKNELFTLGIVMIVVNSMTMRPLYPAVMAAGMVGIHLIITQVVLNDPRVVLVSGYIEAFNHEAVRQSDGTWVRSYNFTPPGGVQHTASLQARVDINGTEWQMFISKPNAFTDLLGYTGGSNLRLTEGTS